MNNVLLAMRSEMMLDLQVMLENDGIIPDAPWTYDYKLKFGRLRDILGFDSIARGLSHIRGRPILSSVQLLTWLSAQDWVDKDLSILENIRYMYGEEAVELVKELSR